MSTQPSSGSMGAYLWDQPPSEAEGRPTLHRDRIVEVAIKLADEHGVDALSMRRLATGLGSGTMSLYRYVASKDDLLLLLNDAVLGEEELPDELSGDWRTDLRGVMNLHRRVAQRHPWWVRTSVGRPQIGPNALRVNEFSLGALDGSGLGITVMQAMVTMLQSFVLGMVTYQLAEAEVVRDSGIDAEEWQRSMVPWAERLVAGGQHPLNVRFMVEGEHWDDDELFAYGAERVLDGVAAALPAG